MMLLQAGSYIVTYSAADKAGNVGTASRIVGAIDPCISPEHFCSSTCRSVTAVATCLVIFDE